MDASCQRTARKRRREEEIRRTGSSYRGDGLKSRSQDHETPSGHEGNSPLSFII